MNIPPGDILRDTEPTPVPGIDGRYEGAIPEAWRIFYAFGGSTMAAALRAACAEVARDDLHLLSADATFCQAVPCGPVAMQVEVLRQAQSIRVGRADELERLAFTVTPDRPSPSNERPQTLGEAKLDAHEEWHGSRLAEVFPLEHDAARADLHRTTLAASPDNACEHGKTGVSPETCSKLHGNLALVMKS